MKKLTILQITLVAFMVALLAICSWISIPFAIPFTLQTFALFLTLRLLGGKLGLVTIFVYLLLGTIGVPVFSNFGGGLDKLLGPAGGFLFGFLFTGTIYLFLDMFPFRGKAFTLLKMWSSMVPCYLVGASWFYFTVGVERGDHLGTVILTCVVPFLLPDLVKMILAVFLGERLEKLLPKSLNR